MTVLLNLVMLQGGGKKKYDEDEDFEDTENSEDTDSDFEDPDTIEVPKTLNAGDKKAAAAAPAGGMDDGSDDDIEVISSTNNGTKFGFGKPGKLLKEQSRHLLNFVILRSKSVEDKTK